MQPVIRKLMISTLALSGSAGAAVAQSTEGFDPVQVALAWHKLTGEPLDLRAVAAASDAVRRATQFDRPDAIKAEASRLEGLLAAADPKQEWVIQVGDFVTQYDHDRGEFSIQLFTPGYYVPAQAFGQEYQIVFANAESARAIPMPKEEARQFDALLNRTGRRLTNEIRFRITGRGDPAGAVTGARVVRAEIVATRLLDNAGVVVFTPRVGPPAVAAGASPAAPAFDAAAADVAGLRVGVPGKDLEATLTRLYGRAVRGKPMSGTPAGIAATLEVNGGQVGCMNIGGRRNNPKRGSVCLTAFLDQGDVVRSIRIERVFPWMDYDVFRRTLVARYGPVTAASGASLAWGPTVDKAWGGFNALVATFGTNEDLMDAGLNRRPDTRVALLLVDARWAAEHAK